MTKRLAGCLAIAGAALLTGWGCGASRPDSERLVIYCATGLRPALEPIARLYEAESGRRVALQFGPSGGLEAQIRLAGKGDLFLPAAAEPYLERMRDEGLVDAITPLVTQRLVLALRDRENSISSIADLLDQRMPFGVCNVQAAAGWRTKQALVGRDLWQRVRSEATAMFPTVTELASAVRDGGRLRAGIVWDTTAEQFGLLVRDMPELAGAQADVSIGILSTCRNAGAAGDFVQFVASENGLNEFLQRGYGKR